MEEIRQIESIQSEKVAYDWSWLDKQLASVLLFWQYQQLFNALYNLRHVDLGVSFMIHRENS